MSCGGWKLWRTAPHQHKWTSEWLFCFNKHHSGKIYNQSVYTLTKPYLLYISPLEFWCVLKEVFFLAFKFLSFSTYQQDFAVQELPSTQKIQHVESVDAEEQGQPQRSYEQQEKNVHEKARQQHAPNKADGEKKYEPCPRWKNLGLMPPCGYVITPLVVVSWNIFRLPRNVHSRDPLLTRWALDDSDAKPWSRVLSVSASSNTL